MSDDTTPRRFTRRDAEAELTRRGYLPTPMGGWVNPPEGMHTFGNLVHSGDETHWALCPQVCDNGLTENYGRPVLTRILPREGEGPEPSPIEIPGAVRVPTSLDELRIIARNIRDKAEEYRDEELGFAAAELEEFADREEEEAR